MFVYVPSVFFILILFASSQQTEGCPVALSRPDVDCPLRYYWISPDIFNQTHLTTAIYNLAYNPDTSNPTIWTPQRRLAFQSYWNGIRQAVWNTDYYPTAQSRVNRLVYLLNAYSANVCPFQAYFYATRVCNRGYVLGTVGDFVACGNVPDDDVVTPRLPPYVDGIETDASQCPAGNGGCCPANTSGVITHITGRYPGFFSVNNWGVMLGRDPVQTCAGCPTGQTEYCFDSSDVLVSYSYVPVPTPPGLWPTFQYKCETWENFCACPSDGMPCYHLGPHYDQWETVVYSQAYCDPVCFTYLILDGASTHLTNGIVTVSVVDEYLTQEPWGLRPLGLHSPYIRAPYFAVSCNGCDAISTNGRRNGTAVNCTGPISNWTGWP